MSVRIGYTCSACGHQFYSRNPTAKKRECSRCGSTQVTKDIESQIVKTEDGVKESATVSVASDGQLNLEEIQRALARFDGYVKTMARFLSNDGVLNPTYSGFLDTYCIWCGAEREVGMQYDKANGTWRCASCGRASD